MEKKMIDCPDCTGQFMIFCVTDNGPQCPTCGDTGKVEAGTKSWMQNFLESKEGSR